MTRHLCQVANVSPSGYYKWLQNKEKHALREEADYQDYILLKSIYDRSERENWLSWILYGTGRCAGHTDEP